MSFDLDLDLDPITLTLKFGLDMVKIYMYTENEVSSLGVQMLWPEQTDRDKDTETDPNEIVTYPHTPMVRSMWR